MANYHYFSTGYVSGFQVDVSFHEDTLLGRATRSATFWVQAYSQQEAESTVMNLLRKKVLNDERYVVKVSPEEVVSKAYYGSKTFTVDGDSFTLPEYLVDKIRDGWVKADE